MRSRRQEFKRFAIFALVPLAIFTLVLVVPFTRGVWFTFTDWDGFEVTSFVGLDNYVGAFQDESFWGSMLLTLAYVAASLVLVNAVAFGLALLVTIPLRGVNVLARSESQKNMASRLRAQASAGAVFNSGNRALRAATTRPIFEPSDPLIITTSPGWIASQRSGASPSEASAYAPRRLAGKA